ncbi:Uncharacterised protein r2_g521 [Pycnogonum litorale]
MAMDLSAIMAEAKEIGLEGKALQDFVRDERAHQREIERIRLGQIEQEKNRQHELALCEAKRNLPVVTRDNNLPKLPPLDENDEIDAYLCRFENYAEACNWSEDSWSIRLSALLKGQALEVYHGIPKESAHNYAALRKMLLNRFQMTEEGYRQKFRRLRPRVHESFGQFVSRLNLALDRWIEMSEVDSTVQGIKDLALKEQCLEVVSKDLKVFIQERQPKSLGEVIELAENYISVHMLQSANSKWWNQQQRDQGNGSRMHVRERDITKDNKPRDMRELVTVKNERDKGAPRKGCFLCGGKHYARDCRVIQDKAKSESYTNKAQVDTVTADWEPVVEGTICGIEEPVSVLRDTGCSTAVIKRKFVKDDQYTGKWVKCKMVNGQIIEVPTATVQVDTPFYEGIITAMVMISPANDLVIGNIPGAKDATNPSLHWKSSEPVTERVAMVTTRSQAIVREKMGEKPMKVHDTEISKVTKDEFRMLQENDETLKGVKEKAERGDGQNKLGNAEFRYVNGLLCRYFSKDGEMGNASGVTQLVVPEKLRKLIMELAHDSILGGHLGVQKTLDRILGEFYWPGVHGDIKRYCRSCDICQRTIPKGKVRKAPLESVPMVNTPFAKVAVDLVGPLLKSSRGYRYILTVVDYATRYPEAIPLKSIETVDVAEALLDIFSRVGIPHEIVSDRGSQFVSDMMKEFMRLLSLKHIKTTPYHAMANGLVEKWNGTLKCMLKRMSCERPKDWDRYIPVLLFAYREVPQESLKFSPFELLYGRTVRGPLTIVKEMWLEERENISCPESSHQYILELKSKLEDTCRLAREELRKAKITQKSYYDKRNCCKRPPIKKGDKVLLLLPTDNNKLLLQWKGPFPVVEQVGENDFQIMVNNKVRTYHANMLKRYLVRDENSERACVAKVVTECESEGCEKYSTQLDYPSVNEESWKDVKIDASCSEEQKKDVKELLLRYQDILTDKPGRTDLLNCEINVREECPFRKRSYPVPYAMREEINSEIVNMENLGVIELSVSEYVSPAVMVKKADGSYRFCIDFRSLNKLLTLDAEPIPNPDRIFSNLGGSKYFSKLDMSKGFWQIPIKPEHRHHTAFQTDRGLRHFTVMPFGLVNATAVFSRMVRKLLDGVKGVENYVDDIVVHSKDWETHLKILDEVFERLRSGGLTVRPTKCELGKRELSFLGRVIDGSNMFLDDDKVQKVINFKRPQTKSQLRSFIGVVSYHRIHIKEFATILKPLTDLTKKTEPVKVRWNCEAIAAFEKVKELISTKPILKLPDFEREFILATDASETGIGAVLMQDYDGKKLPVKYISRKLTAAESRYSTIERECLALFWATRKFHEYLYSKPFILETDHKPLIFLSSARHANNRVMRWALALQTHQYTIRAVKGSENKIADFLSRC